MRPSTISVWVDDPLGTCTVPSEPVVAVGLATVWRRRPHPAVTTTIAAVMSATMVRLRRVGTREELTRAWSQLGVRTR